MKHPGQHLIPLALFVILLAAPGGSSAQRLQVFITGGTHNDGGGYFAGVTGGGTYDVAHEWISVGGETDVFLSWPYAAARVGPVAQLNILRQRRFRPFAIGGYKWGEAGGPLAGGGLDFRPGGKIGFRVTVEDHFRRTARLVCGPPFPPCSALPNNGNPFFRHAVSVQAGITFH